jgi:hypothetical protein
MQYYSFPTGCAQDLPSITLALQNGAKIARPWAAAGLAIPRERAAAGPRLS